MINRFEKRYSIDGLYYSKYSWSEYWRDAKYGHGVTDKKMIKKLNVLVALEKL